MTKNSQSGVVTGRLDAKTYVENFSDLHPALSENKALNEADKCYFCYDAPCMQACPTSIDIPLFIRQISAGTPDGAAQTIFASNILGGMCARVCPTETLCEEVCVHVEQGNKAVKIGELQRYATDFAMQSGAIEFTRQQDTGKNIAVVGAGPAGLACAHSLSAKGHKVTIYEAREKPGGLNEFGLAAYKTTNNFAQKEVDFVLSIGGINIKYGQTLGKDISVTDLTNRFDAVFLSIGLGDTRDLGIEGQSETGVRDAVDYIAEIRQADDLSDLPVGQQVVVIGGGMTAIDIAVQIKKLGARDVTLAYRRGPDQMGASEFERELAQTNDVAMAYWAMPDAVKQNNGHANTVSFERSRLNSSGKLVGTGEFFSVPADQIFAAIGQTLNASNVADSGLAMTSGRIEVDEARKTSLEKVWAGGDCVAGGDDLTVSSVEDGNIAASAIDAFLKVK